MVDSAVKDNEDILYHLGISTKTYDFKHVFGDLRFVCCGGSMKRIETFAQCLCKVLPLDLPFGVQPTNLCRSDRYVMYKVGPVLCVNHGIGIPSLSIVLHEVFKLLRHAGCKDVTLFRIGTSGGIGLPAGTLVIAESALDGLLEESYEMTVLGERIRYPTQLDKTIVEELKQIAIELRYPVVSGKTLAENDFYEGQGRIDGALCSYTAEQRAEFLRRAYDKGVRNIEMEATCVAAMCLRAHIKAAVICVTLLDRLKGDQVTTPMEELRQLEQRPMKVVLEYICRRIKNAKN